jgi:hypothetical protein
MLLPYILFGSLAIAVIYGLIKKYTFNLKPSLKDIGWQGVAATLISFSLIFQKKILGVENGVVLKFILIVLTVSLILLEVLKKKEDN